MGKKKKKTLNEMEASNRPDTEFKPLVITMLKEFRRKIDELRENFNKEIVSIKEDTETITKN